MKNDENFEETANLESKVVIECNVQLKIGNGVIDVKTLLDFIKKIKDKPYIDYGDDVQFYCEYKNGDLVRRKFGTKNNVSDKIDKSGIYFILSYEEDKLLYVGKSKNCFQRIKDHLIQCNTQTYSHIKDTYDYLLKRNDEEKSLKIKYCTINVSDSRYNSSVEGIIIDYILNCINDNDFLSDCWNIRED